MNAMRLSITPELRQVLDILKLRYPSLEEPEILKVGLSELYVKTLNSPCLNLAQLKKHGRQHFQAWLKQKGKEIDELTEEEAYQLIENA